MYFTVFYAVFYRILNRQRNTRILAYSRRILNGIRILDVFWVDLGVP